MIRKTVLKAIVAASVIVAGGVIFAPAAVAATPATPCPANNVCLYQDFDFKGGERDFPVDGGDVNEFSGNFNGSNVPLNDNASSVINNTDKTVRFFPDFNFGGAVENFGTVAVAAHSSVDEFAGTQFNGEDALNDQASSFKFE